MKSIESHEEFWRRQFLRPVELPSLPFCKLRPPVPSYLRDTVELTMDRSVSKGLGELSSKLEVQPLAVLLAALKTVLFRYVGLESLVVGTAIQAAVKPSDSSCPVLPIQTHWDVQADLSGSLLAKEVAQRIEEANIHAAYPLRELQIWAGAEDAAYGSRLFNVALCLATAPSDKKSGWPMRDPDLGEFLTQCDVVFTATWNSSNLTLEADFDSDLLETESMHRWLVHFGNILNGIVSDPEMTVLHLPMLAANERSELLGIVNDSMIPASRLQRFPDSAGTLHRLFEEQVARTPGASALTFDGVSLTYAQLNSRANRLAWALRDLGVGPDVLVGLCLERSSELVIGLLAILKAGGAYLPIDLAYPAERLAFMLEDAQAPVLLTQRKLARELPTTHAKLLCLEEFLAQPVQSGEDKNPPPLSGPESLAYVIYTSGTTGKPKGSLITHRNVVRLFSSTEHWYAFDERDVWTLFHSCAFDFSVWEIWGALLYGGRLVVVPFLVSRSPQSFRELLIKEQVTVLNQTPSAFRQLIQTEEEAGQKLLTLRYVIFGGEALEMQNLRPWFERHGDQTPRLVNMYGITETTVHVTYRALSKGDLSSGSVIGVPIPDLQIYILDAQRQPVPTGVPGEIYVGGAGLARGYLNRPELTAERFVPDHLTGRPGSRLYRTGDLARFLPSRDVEYLGRIDQQVKIRGFRIELGEIESVLCQHQSVREGIVLAREEAQSTKQLVAYLVVSGPRPAVTELRNHLKKFVPDYMVPAAFVFLDKFPLTNNGKIDRKLLPAPQQDRPDLGATLVAPRTAVEETMAGIWNKVLRLERVGVHDNFFELGGDSILAIQIVSLFRQAGFALSPKLLFQHQTIADLAAVLTPTLQQPEAEQGLVQGTAPLTAIQHWFLEQKLAQPNHYNQAFLFKVNEPLEVEPMERALAHLERHHDALRLRMAASHASEQTFAVPSAAIPFERVNLAQANESEVESGIEEAASRAQATLDFTNGPLWRAIYFDLGPERHGRLFLAIHHLAVDGVSWRILIEDLERAYIEERTGHPTGLPAKTTSVKEWADRLTELISREGVPGGAEYWQMLAAEQAGTLPVEKNDGENSEASAVTVTVRLSLTETDALLQRSPAAYGTQINDLLVAALARTLAEWTTAESIWINLEGHGREELFEGVDLSRTVGWFTTIYPVRLQIPDGETAEWIKSVKEQLRSIPARGIGFGLQRYLVGDHRLSSGPEPQILFNYLGQFDQVVSGSRLFGFAQEPTGPWHSPLSIRRHLLEVNCIVVNGQLELDWTYSANRHTAKTIERLAQDYLSRLTEIIQHCTTPGVRGATPSDFPLASLNQEHLDGLLRRLPDLEDVYPLSPIQTLFYTAGANDSKVVMDHWHGTLSGPLESQRFQRAWELVFERHAVLRTSFQSRELSEPLQVVHKGLRSAWREENWTDVSESEQAARWERFLESDREQGMDLAQPPLSRLTLIQLGAQRYKFIWTVPALLLDGWSWPLVFRDLSLAYDAVRAGKPAAYTSARPYRDCVAWFHARSWSETEEFWRHALRGVTEPTPLATEVASSASVARGRHAKWCVALDPTLTARLTQLARKLQLTPNTLIQAAWALVLARLSGQSDVVFGAAFSGRPADLPGAENIVGPFVNNLPVRVNVNESTSTAVFLQELHTQLLRLNEHQFAPLARIQSWTDVPWRHRLFDSIVVVQNYMVDEAARRLGNTVAISDFVAPIHTNYPLLVLAEPKEAWRFTLIYDVSELPEAAIQRWGLDLVRTMDEFAAKPESSVAELLAQLSAPIKTIPTKRRWRVSTQNYLPPQTELEGQLAHVWEEMLQIEKISIEENIFDLGAHSLLVIQLHGRLCETIGQNFPLVTMFQFPTIQGLARFLSRKNTDDQSRAEIQSRAQLQREAMIRLRSGGKQR